MPKDNATGSGCVDYIAFRIESYNSLLTKAREQGWHFLNAPCQIYTNISAFYDPNNIKVELIFHDDEYQAWQKQQTVACS